MRLSGKTAGDAHDGVFIAFRRDLLCNETPELDTKYELIWCKLNIIDCRTLYLGSFYRPPNQTEKEYHEAFNISLTRIMSNKMLMFWLGVTSIGEILSGAVCRYLRGYRKGT